MARLIRPTVAIATLAALLGLSPAAAQDSAGSGEGQLLDEVVAVVNDGVILRSDLELRLNRVRQRLRERDTRMPPMDVLREQVLDRLVVEEVQVQRARRSGIRVEDSELDEALRRLAQQNGTDLESFSRQLERSGTPFSEFRDQIRRQLLMENLRRRDVARRITITKREVDNFLENEGGIGQDQAEYRLRHILVSLPDDPAPATVERAREKTERLAERIRGGADFAQMAIRASDGQQALEGGDLGWREGSKLPTIFADSVARLEVGEISEPIRSPSGFHLIKLAQRRGGERVRVEEVLVRHILIETDQLTSSEEARDKLAALRERVVSGEADFRELARYHSDDTETASDGGELGWTRPQAVPGAFRTTLEELGVGEVSEPFQTGSGWHIAQVVDRRVRDSTQQSRRNRARQVLFQRKMQEETEIYLQRLRDEAYIDIRLDQA